MKRILALILILIPLWLVAQEIPFSVKAKTRYSTSGMVGYETINGERYYQLRIIPEFRMWKFRMGFDLPFLFDMDYRFRTEDWDDFDSLLDKIYYIKFASPKDPFYFHLGGFPGLTVGSGLIMQNYSNMLLYPELRHNGIMIGAKPPVFLKPGFEIFTSDYKKNEILALSLRAQPMPDSTFEAIDELVVGFHLVTDRNQYSNLKYMVSDSLLTVVDALPDQSVTAYGFAYSLPLFRKGKVTLGQYGEYAHIDGAGSGMILPGVYVELGNVKFNLEYRFYGSGFTPAFFDQDYEEMRAFQPDDSLAVFVTKKDTLKDIKRAKGIKGSVEAFMFKKVRASVAWQNLIGEDMVTGKSLWLKLWVDTQYKRLENFSLAYSKTNTASLGIDSVIQPNAEIKATATFRIYKDKWYVIGKYSERYKEKDGNGEITWNKETRRSGGLGLKLLY